MAAQPGTPAHDKAKLLLASYRERGKAAAQADLDAMIAEGMTTFEYVAVTDTFRALLKQGG